MTAVPIASYASKIGYSSNIPTTFNYLQNVATVDPSSSGEGAKVISTSSDDGPSGNGILMVRVRYFDTSWVLNDEYVTMNGTSSVTLSASNIMRIEAFEAFQTGANGIATGTITLKSTDGSKLFAQIDPGYVSFLTSIHTVAPGDTCYVLAFTLSCSTTGGVEYAIFVEKDNTGAGGGIVIFPFIGTTLGQDTVVGSNFQNAIICDASLSTVGLRMGILAKAYTSSQIGAGSYLYNEI